LAFFYLLLVNLLSYSNIEKIRFLIPNFFGGLNKFNEITPCGLPASGCRRVLTGGGKYDFGKFFQQKPICF